MSWKREPWSNAPDPYESALYRAVRGWRRPRHEQSRLQGNRTVHNPTRRELPRERRRSRMRFVMRDVVQTVLNSFSNFRELERSVCLNPSGQIYLGAMPAKCRLEKSLPDAAIVIPVVKSYDASNRVGFGAGLVGFKMANTSPRILFMDLAEHVQRAFDYCANSPLPFGNCFSHSRPFICEMVISSIVSGLRQRALTLNPSGCERGT